MTERKKHPWKAQEGPGEGVVFDRAQDPARGAGPASVPPGRPDLKFERYGSPTAVLDVKEAAAYLAVSVSTAWRMVRSGVIPHVRVGPKAVRVRVVDLDRYLEEHLSRTWTRSEVAGGKTAGAKGEHG